MFFQFILERRYDRHRVKHRIDGIFRGADNTGQYFLLTQRDAQLGIGFQQFRIDFVERFRAVFLLRGGVVIEVLIIDLLVIDLGPVGFIHGQPALIGRQTHVQHPFRLVLLGGNKAHDIGVQPFGGELHFDIGDKTMLISL